MSLPTDNIQLLEAVGFILAFVAAIVFAGLYIKAKRNYQRAINQEIDQRIASEKELLNSERRLLEAQKIADIGHYEWDINNSQLWCSDVTRRIYGLSEEIFPTDFNAIVAGVLPEHQQYVRENLSTALNEGKTYNVEYAIRSPEGKEHWIHNYGKVSFDDSGKPRFMRGTIQVITSRKQAELALQDKINLLNTISSSLPTPIYTKNCNGVFLDCNEAFAELIGKQRSEIINHSLEDIFTPEQAKTYRDADKRLLQKGDIQTYEAPFEDRWGKVHDVEFHKAVYYDAEGHTAGIVGAMIDITDRKENEKALREGEKLLEQAQRIAQVGHWAWDLASNEIIASDQMLAIHGLDKKNPYSDAIKLKEMRSTLPKEDLKRLDDLFKKNIDEGHTNFELRHRIHRKNDNELRFLDTRVSIIRNELGEPVSVQGTCQDITRQHQYEENLRVFSRALEQSSTAILITNKSGHIVYVNPAFEEASGYSESETLGEYPWIVRTTIDGTPLDQKTLSIIQNYDDWEGELHCQARNGEWYWEYATVSPVRDNDGTISQYVWVRDNISVRKAQEQALHHQANFDVLTDLPNRALAIDRLNQTIKAAKRNDGKAAVLFIDLDGFKKVNDTMGHEIGDGLLIEAASRLRDSVRESDTVARLGGDEFLIILPYIHSENDAKHIAANLLSKFNAPFIVDGRDIIITTSIGITIYPNDGEIASDLLRNADGAMYESKQAGRNTYSFYTHQMNAEAQQRLEIETHMRRALDHSGFELFYQPIVSGKDGSLARMEALLRWNDEKLGFIPPDKFIPIAEETGMITRLGSWVIEEACRQSRYWLDKGIKGFKMAINVSPRQFRDKELIDTIVWNLSRFELPAQVLEIEVTEGLLLYDWPDTDRILDQLDKMGISISIDDFGTGYSSLSYLKRYPFDTLKIDRAFVKDIHSNPADAELVSAMIAMAKALGLDIVAEGVETQAHADFLREQKCTFLQGYHFAKPMSPDDFERWFDKRTSAQKSA